MTANSEHRSLSSDSERDFSLFDFRTEDAVVYGYKCGQSGIFYKQNSTTQNGLPAPADVMGTISISAKRRLERDHSIILM